MNKPDARSIVAALKGRWNGSTGIARCPAHDDRSPSLSVTDAYNGRVLVNCFSGCTQKEIIGALQQRGLWPEKQEARQETAEARRARRKADRERRDREAREVAKRREGVARDAQSMIQRANLNVHPYLAAKGFPKQKCWVLDDVLLVPMRPAENYCRIASLQRIAPDGSKKFLAGGRVKGCVLRLGRPSKERWWCEGFATGLSVYEALKALRRPASVIVCFSAGNLAHVAKRGFVVADRDKSGAGEDAAKKTGLPYWLPPDEGTDANDYHLAAGVDALAAGIGSLFRQCGTGRIDGAKLGTWGSGHDGL